DELEDCYAEQLELADDATTRQSVLVKLGNLRREKLGNPSGALEVYRQVAEQAPSHFGAQAALNSLLESEDFVLRREAASVLVTVYERTQAAADLLRVYRVLVEVEEDPIERVQVLESAVELAQNKIGDATQAFELCVRAIEEGVGHVELEPWTTRL